MLAALRLECIGDDTNALFQLGRRTYPDAALLGRDPMPKPWVARITGLDPKYGLAREFLRGQKDYTDANSTGSRGVFLTYWLPEGIYEVYERTGWKSERRFFCRSEQGRLVRMTQEEVLAWLENPPSESTC